MVKMSYYAEYTDVVADKHKVPGYRGVPPKNFGRFIPCRGGGTATTYYADSHDVDEDKVSIVPQGGQWTDRIWSGITNRNMTSISSAALSDVASRLIYLS